MNTKTEKFGKLSFKKENTKLIQDRDMNPHSICLYSYGFVFPLLLLSWLYREALQKRNW